MTDKNDKPVVNFVILQSVEDYVEKSGKFRTKCGSFKIPGRDSGGANTVYIPYCEKQRFDFGHQLNEYRGQGVFKPPEIGRPWEIPDFIVFREHFHDIHCPQPCRGYRNKRIVALFEKIRPRIPAAGKWMKKDIVNFVIVPLLLCAATALLGWLTPEGRRLLHLDKPQQNVTVQARIRILDVVPVVPAQSGAAFPALNIYYDNAGSGVARGVVSRFGAGFGSGQLPDDRILEEQDNLLQWDGWQSAMDRRKQYEMHPGDPGEFTSIPNMEGSLAAQFRSNWDKVSVGTTVLYVFITFKYFDPSGEIGVTENCFWFSGGFARHDCGRGRTFIEHK